MSELQAPCRNCGLRNEAGRDFCEQCGEYLSWAPTRHIAAVQAGQPAADAGADEDDGGAAVATPADRDTGTDGGRRASFEDEDEDAGDDDGGDGPGADDAASAAAVGGNGDGGGEGAVATPPPEVADGDAADGPAAVQEPASTAPEQVEEEDATATAEAAATDAQDGVSDKPSKRGRRGQARRARRGDRAPRRGRLGRGRATPAVSPEADVLADPDAPAPVPVDEVEGAAIAPTPPEVAAQAPPPAPAEADTSAFAEATEAPAPPPAPADDPSRTAAMPPPPESHDDGLAPPPLAPPPPPLPSVPTASFDAGATPAPSGDASIILTPEALTLGAAGVPAVEAGGTLSYNATIRNESRLVDNYELAVLGLPEGWSVVTPPTAFLVPLGSGRGESDTTVRIDISPPRHYRSTAGIWTFELIAMSRTTATVAGRAIAQFEVKPFPSWSVEVVPVVNSGRLKARYRIAVRNDGNAEQDLWLLALEDSGRLRTRFKAGSLTLQPGSVGVDVLTLRPRLPLPVGRVKEHRVGVDAVDTPPETDDEDGAQQEGQARGGGQGEGQAAGRAARPGREARPRRRDGRQAADAQPGDARPQQDAEAQDAVQAGHGDAPAAARLAARRPAR